MAFRVGQKVVCVDDNFGIFARRFTQYQYPVAQDVYTIREALVDWDGIACIRLCELKNPPGPCAETGEFCEPRFMASRFRPLIERKHQTDISIFVKMLNPKKVDA